MRRVLLLSAGILLASTGMAMADFRWYESDGSGGWQTMSTMESDQGDFSFLCLEKGCISVRCNACHAKAADEQAFARDASRKHQLQYFSKAAVQVAEGKSLVVGSTKIVRQGGRLRFQDGSGRQFQLPADAQVIAGSNRQPAFVVFEGRQLPQLVK
jgi:hypothetical protein